MSTTTAVADKAITRKLDSLRQMVDAEIARTNAERDAFDSFHSRLSELPGLAQQPTARETGAGGAGSEGGLSVRSQTDRRRAASDTIAAIQTAYEETVMDLSFYEGEYGDTYPESLRSEFGGDVAIALTRSECFTSAVRSSLLNRVDAALTERERLLDICHTEREALNGTRSDVISVAEECRSIASVVFDQQNYEELQYHRDRLLRLRENCETIVRRRQTTLNSRRERYELPDEDPDFCPYIYRDSEDSYPLLSLCSSLVARIAATQHDVERAMAYCG